MEHECEGAKPSWATDHGLQLCGQYYEGFVDDYEAVYTRHRIETVTSYGVRRSRQNASGESNCHPDDKENIEAQDNNSQALTTKINCTPTSRDVKCVAGAIYRYVQTYSLVFNLITGFPPTCQGASSLTPFV